MKSTLSLLSLLLFLVGTSFAFQPIPKTPSFDKSKGTSHNTAGLKSLENESNKKQRSTVFGASPNLSIRNHLSFYRLDSNTRRFMAGDSADGTSPVKIIIAGAPASGKGTQCEVIKEKFGVVHLSTGDMLRAAVAAGTEVGKKAKDFMDSGKLVPDDVIIGIVKDRLAENDCQTRGWLLDGFPRTAAQARALEDAGVEADCFIFLNVPDEILIERVVGRRTDPETGKIYHMKFSPPEDDEIRARLEQRSDDTEEKVKVRLEQFHTNVDAVKDSYTNISVTIDGDRAPATVSQEIFKGIKSKVSSLKA